MIGHFLLSMVLLVAAFALAWRATFEPGERRPAPDRLTTWSVRALLIPGALTLSLGTIATAAGPHAGGEGTGDIVPRLRWRGADTLNWAIHQHGASPRCSGCRRSACGSSPAGGERMSRRATR